MKAKEKETKGKKDRDNSCNCCSGSCKASATDRKAEHENKNSTSTDFDLILVDSTDFGAANVLFTQEFYKNLQLLLRDPCSSSCACHHAQESHHGDFYTGGILSLNVESPSYNLPAVVQSSRKLGNIFNHAYLYQVFIPTYMSGHYTFMMASDHIHPYDFDGRKSTSKPENTLMQERIKRNWLSMVERVRTEFEDPPLRYYTTDGHLGAFALPRFVQDALPFPICARKQ